MLQMCQYLKLFPEGQLSHILKAKKNRGCAGHCLWPISMCVYKIWTKHLKYTNNTATEKSDCHVMKTYSKMLISQSEAQAL